MIKLRDSEAQHLAALLVRIGRPRSEDEAKELNHWVQRLEGSRDNRVDV